ncbi:Ku protein [Dermatophilus congolensis]|uniref:non-homologous end joining protein Ku n=2 Tax=Dermatophilus congolensis TaxID=1863 RepID=UPI001AAF126B|nr:Ku protein [Dermatophilus congolensis]MBO3129466.1 Ku protein [Dermatophilus congolensis]MBO3131901.1 Ku protein [Dermatophilus congolensis]MBO3133942.1 Ku protein [Dermatophilus congolensis]MBO3136173.1 Ku protein [Dermatophilus congolensis]MBO3138417.1 Ku protein [Dermatophilus congolensis]
MRAMWKGAVSFGLVTVPVRLYSATENHDLKFHQVRKSDGSRIKYKRVAEADGAQVDYKDIAKGYETADGRTVVITDEELEALPSRSSREISVEKFVPAEQIDPILFDKAYYLEPDPAAVKPYALLRETLRTSERMAVATISVRTRLTMAVLRVHGEVIVCQTLLWPDEVREPDFEVLNNAPAPKRAEMKMATMLIESMAENFEPNEYEDDYTSAVEALVQTKLDGAQVKQAVTEHESPAQVVDLLAALQRSVDRAKAARAGSGGAASDLGTAQRSESKPAKGTNTAKTKSAKKSTKKSQKSAKKSQKTTQSTAKKSAATKPAKKTAGKPKSTKAKTSTAASTKTAARKAS